MSATGINQSKMIKSIMEAKKGAERLEHLINYLKMENFEYALRRNHMENTLSKINTLINNCPGKLVAASNNICDLLQVQGSSEMKEKTMSLHKSINEKKTPSVEKIFSCNKAHVVKPHMVNGHILYIPTINLTRVSDINSPNKSLKQTENRSTLESRRNNDISGCISTQPSSSRLELSDHGMDTSSDTLVEDEDRISQGEDIGEASTSSSRSPSHSTVLSGTFQEVKIYLNQISPETLNEESRKLITSSRNSRLTGSPRKACRNGVSLGRVTKRKKK